MYAQAFKSIASQMVFHPGKLDISQVDKLNSEINIGVKCDIEDYALLIGKGARNIRALKVIFDYIGKSKGTKIFISVAQTGEQFNGSRRQVPLAANWTGDRAIAKLFSSILEQTGYSSQVDPESAGNKTVLKVYASRPIPADLQDAAKIVMACVGRMKGRIVEIDV